jgi:hypothetical protein
MPRPRNQKPRRGRRRGGQKRGGEKIGAPTAPTPDKGSETFKATSGDDTVPQAGDQPTTRAAKAAPSLPRAKNILRSQAWSGVSGVVAIISGLLSIVAIVVTVWAVRYGLDLQRKERQATIDVHTEYVAQDKGAWMVRSVIYNRGPGTARRMQIAYGTPSVSMCSNQNEFEIGPSPDPSASGVDYGYKCGDISLTHVGVGKPAHHPFMFPRELSDDSKILPLNQYSATCAELFPGETVWLEFSFKASDEVDRKLRRLVPFEDTELLADNAEKVHAVFSEVFIGGVDIEPGTRLYASYGSE